MRSVAMLAEHRIRFANLPPYTFSHYTTARDLLRAGFLVDRLVADDPVAACRS